MTFAQFSRRARLSGQDICRQVLYDHRRSIKTKKEQTAVKNLALIFEAALKVSNQKGFSAMTMRDLSQASGLSMGALYDYFASKEELLEMLQTTGRNIIGRITEESLEGIADPLAKLVTAIQTHVYLSEVMRPWFFFSYMEARHLGQRQKELAKKSELAAERRLADIIAEGGEQGVFAEVDPSLTAAVIKAMMQDWYLKRWKYGKRQVSVDRYADTVVEMVLAYCLAGQEQGAAGEVREKWA